MTDEISPPPETVSFLRVGKRRLEIFIKACTKFGLTVVDHSTSNALILIDDELDFISANKIFKGSSSRSSPIFVRTQWLSDSIKQNKLISYQSYVLHAISSQSIISGTELSDPPKKNEIPREPPPLKRERSISSSASDTDDESSSKKVFHSVISSCIYQNLMFLV